MAKPTQVTALLSAGKYKEARALIRQAFETHLTRKEVLAALGVSERSMSVLRTWLRRIKDAGYDDPREGLTIARHGRRVDVFRTNGVSTTDALTGKAIRARKNGKKLHEIARDLGVSEATASRKVRGVQPAHVRRSS